MTKGMLITFEGGEGAGKSTLIKHLAQEMESLGYSILCTRAPGSLRIGEKIRDLLLHSDLGEITPKTELFLFLADRASHVDHEIRPALEMDKIVLCDRFNDSTVAYQGMARGLGEDEVEKLCTFACSGLKPDLTFYLDIDPALGLQRATSVANSDRIESETLAFHQRIREAYQHIAKKEPKRVYLIDAKQPPEHVYKQAWDLLKPRLLHVART
ncbi:MAG: dTMP kinase [Simkania sp.]|nr:dTMP kinase [Simkania sp.]